MTKHVGRLSARGVAWFRTRKATEGRRDPDDGQGEAC